MDFLKRQQKLREQVTSAKLDALLVSHLSNIRYLCGFTGSAGFLLVTEKISIFFTDTRYNRQAREEVNGANVVIARKALLNSVGEWIAACHKRTKGWILGIEAERLTVAERKQLANLLPAGSRMRNAPPLVERARMVKDEHELVLIRAAVRLGASLFDRALQVLRPGIKEVEVAAEMEYTARCAGAEAMSFPTIIASGARSAMPHGRATEQLIAPGSFVVCDFGVILAGYCSDQTRTIWVGGAACPKDARRAYESVKEAQAAAIAAVRPGVRVADVDAAARRVLRKSGLGRYFTHSTGHGVGLEIHEPPRVAAGQKEVLQSGMVVTIEPGVYFPGRWGVRIEDMVAVNKDGCEVLTPSGKDFLVL